MTFRLSPAALEAGHRLHAFDTIPSTSQEALARARSGETGPAWFVARHQTEGRGRRGATWQTAPGNLAATLLLTTDLPPATVATLGFVAGLALARALEGCRGGADASVGSGHRRASREEGAGGPPDVAAPDGEASTDRGLAAPFRLKWPNDVLGDGAKIAGILLGAEEVAPGRRAVTIGIGVNVSSAPGGLAYPAASLRDLGLEVDAADVFLALSGAWPALASTWDEGRGFDRIRRLWLARAAGLGGDVAVATGAGVARGTFETIDEHGQLVLRLPDGAARHVSAGDVHFGAAATVRNAVSEDRPA